MAEHKRLIVLKRLTALLEGINPEVDPEYVNDMRGRVFRGVTLIGDERKGTIITINEAPRPDFGLYAGEAEARFSEWNLLIAGYVDGDDEHPTDPLYPLLMEVEERLAHVHGVNRDTGDPVDPANYKLGRNSEGQTYIADLHVMPPVVRGPSVQPVARACFYLPIRVGLAE